MTTPIPRKPVINRSLAYGILFALALCIGATLIWSTWLAMRTANPWISLAGVVVAIVYFVIVFPRYRVRITSPHTATRKTVHLRLVKK